MKTPIVRVARYDRRTRAIGGPSVALRRSAYVTHKPETFMQTAKRLTLFIPIETSPTVVSKERFLKAVDDIAKKIKRSKPEAFFISLICAVYVGGNVIYTAKERALIRGSNADNWLPTDRWEVRRLYRNPIRLLRGKGTAYGETYVQLKDSFQRATEDNENNKFVYVIGAEVDLVWFNGK